MTDDKQDPPPMLHRDDVPMDIAEDLVAKLKEVGEEMTGHPVKVIFAGDMTDEQRAKVPPSMIESMQKLHDQLWKEFGKGLCHVCKTQYPGEWPPPENDAEWEQCHWAYYDNDSEESPPLIVCPKCEKMDDHGVPRPVELE